MNTESKPEMGSVPRAEIEQVIADVEASGFMMRSRLRRLLEAAPPADSAMVEALKCCTDAFRTIIGADCDDYTIETYARTAVETARRLWDENIFNIQIRSSLNECYEALLRCNESLQAHEKDCGICATTVRTLGAPLERACALLAGRT